MKYYILIVFISIIKQSVAESWCENCKCKNINEKLQLNCTVDDGKMDKNEIFNIIFSENYHSIAFIDLTGQNLDNLNETQFCKGNESSNIEELNLSNCLIMTIHVEAFYGTEKMKKLILAHNEIENLESGLFKYNDNLEVLELQDSEIRQIPSDIFRNLKKLKKIDLSDNLLESIPHELFADNLELEKIYLEYNRLEIFDPTIFEHLNRLSELRLFYNNWKCEGYLEDHCEIEPQINIIPTEDAVPLKTDVDLCCQVSAKYYNLYFPATR